MKKISLLIGTIIFGILFIMNTVRVVEAKEVEKEALDTRSYRAEVSTLLEEYGIYHGGITMTHTVEENADTNITYTYMVAIHHKKIENLSNETLEEIKGQCKELFAQISDEVICVALY